MTSSAADLRAHHRPRVGRRSIPGRLALTLSLGLLASPLACRPSTPPEPPTPSSRAVAMLHYDTFVGHQFDFVAFDDGWVIYRLEPGKEYRAVQLEEAELSALMASLELDTLEGLPQVSCEDGMHSGITTLWVRKASDQWFSTDLERRGECFAEGGGSYEHPPPVSAEVRAVADRLIEYAHAEAQPAPPDWNERAYQGWRRAVGESHVSSDPPYMPPDE